MSPTASVEASTTQRLVSVDAFRGATIAAMILVNNPGSWGAVYPPLKHATWHGWTPTDLVFPFFLFIVGVAIVLALGRRVEQGVKPATLVPKVLTRVAILIGFGLLLSFVSLFSVDPEPGLQFRGFDTLRIPGVLQRIAVGYGVVALLVLFTRPRTQLWVAIGCLLLYWPLMTLVPVPGHGAPELGDKAANLAAWLDRTLLGDWVSGEGHRHIWSGGKVYDPEGLLSTVPALSTVLLGTLAGRVLRSDRSEDQKVLQLFLYGAPLVILGYVWGWFFPVNKALWTSSYAVFTAGQAMCALALCHWLFDVRGHRRLARPLCVYGVNAITVFVMSGVVGRLIATLIKWSEDGRAVSLKGWIYRDLLVSWAPPELASLLFAVAWVLGWYAVLSWMYRRGIVLKV